MAHSKPEDVNTSISQNDKRTSVHLAASLSHLVILQLLIWVIWKSFKKSISLKFYLYLFSMEPMSKYKTLRGVMRFHMQEWPIPMNVLNCWYIMVVRKHRIICLQQSQPRILWVHWLESRIQHLHQPVTLLTILLHRQLTTSLTSIQI